jgi:hypothetical protein
MKNMDRILVDRLNALLRSSESVRDDISRLIDTRIPVSTDTQDHPSIQVVQTLGKPTLGFLGLLNGLLEGDLVFAQIDNETNNVVCFLTAEEAGNVRKANPSLFTAEEVSNKDVLKFPL